MMARTSVDDGTRELLAGWKRGGGWGLPTVVVVCSMVVVSYVYCTYSIIFLLSTLPRLTMYPIETVKVTVVVVICDDGSWWYGLY